MIGGSIQPFDIWLVRSDPSVGSEFYGKRPAVVIQENFLPEGAGLHTVMLMSSFKEKRWEHDVLVPVTEQNRLWKPTLVKVRHIQSFDTSRFLRKIGILEEEWVEKMKAYLRSHFDL